MIKQVTINQQTVSWDTEKEFQRQEPATQEAINAYTANNAPTNVIPDLVWGNQRTGRKEYDLGSYTLYVTPMYVYNNRPRTAKYKDIIEITEK